MNNNKYLALFEKIYGAKILYDDNGGNPYYIGPLSTVGVDEPRTRFYVDVDPVGPVSGLDEILTMIGAAISKGMLNKISINIEGSWITVRVNQNISRVFGVFESEIGESILDFLNEVIE